MYQNMFSNNNSADRYYVLRVNPELINRVTFWSYSSHFTQFDRWSWIGPGIVGNRKTQWQTQRQFRRRETAQSAERFN